MDDPDNAFGYELENSGEEGLISSWLNQNQSLERPFVFFDVGANRGDWSTYLLQTATIPVQGYCFEPSPTMFARLTDRLAGRPEAQLHNLALSDTAGAAPMRIFRGFEGVNSLVIDADFWDKTYVDTEIIDIQTTTGDGFCAEQGITHIDLLKVDTEGYEWKVLHGFDDMIARQDIDVIQFEYGYVTCNLHVTMKDFYAYLEGHGYILGRLRKGGVDWTPFHYTDNDYFRTPNWVAFSPRATKDV